MEQGDAARPLHERLASATDNGLFPADVSRPLFDFLSGDEVVHCDANTSGNVENWNGNAVLFTHTLVVFVLFHGVRQPSEHHPSSQGEVSIMALPRASLASVEVRMGRPGSWGESKIRLLYPGRPDGVLGLPLGNKRNGLDAFLPALLANLGTSNRSNS